MKKNFLVILGAIGIIGGLGSLVGCKKEPTPGPEPEAVLPDWYYTGGELGTTENLSSMTFRQPTPATENAGLGTMFAQGDQIAEKRAVRRNGVLCQKDDNIARTPAQGKVPRSSMVKFFS